MIGTATGRTVRSVSVARVVLSIFAFVGVTGIGLTALLFSNVRPARAYRASRAGGLLLADSESRLQRGKTDCGETALAIVFDIRRVVVPPTLITPTPWGRTPSDLANLSIRCGLRAEVVRGPLDAIDRLSPPMVILRGNHYLVIETLDERYAVAVDPAIGRIRFSRSALALGWRGFIITFPTNTYSGSNASSTS